MAKKRRSKGVVNYNGRISKPVHDDEASAASDTGDLQYGFVAETENFELFEQKELEESSEEEDTFISQQSRRVSDPPTRSKTHHLKPTDQRRSSSSVLTEQAIQNRENRRHQSHHQTMAKTRGSSSKKGGEKDPTPSQPAQNPGAKERAIIAQMKKEAALKEQASQAAIAKLQAKLDQIQTKKPKKTRGFTNVPVTEDLKALFYTVAKTDLWRSTKFLGDEDELEQATGFCMAKIPALKSYCENEEDKEDIIKAFTDVYGQIVAKAINDTRSNAQGGLKKAYEKRYSEKKRVPTAREVFQMAKREGLEFDPEDPEKNAEMRDMFQWYWEECVVKVCGQKRWGHSIRNYGLISTYTYPGTDTKYVTSSDEALIVILFENCARRFPYTAECRENGTQPDKKADEYQSKYSDDSCGQLTFGGWNLKGRARYSQIRKVISKTKSVRKSEIKAIEKRCLKALQKKNKLDQSKSNSSKAREPKDFEGKEEAKVAMVGLESDDEACNEEEELEVEEMDDEFPTYKPTKKELAEAALARRAAGEDDDDEEEDEDEEKSDK